MNYCYWCDRMIRTKSKTIHDHCKRHSDRWLEDLYIDVMISDRLTQEK